MSGPRRFRPVRDLPTVLWLSLTVAAALAHPWLPVPRWLVLHLFLLGALSHAVLVWSRFFADSVLRAPAGDPASEDRRLLLLNAGTATVVAGVTGGWWPVTAAGATAVVAAVLWHAGVLLRMVRRSLPARFAVTVRFYLAAAAWLPVGATLGVLMARGLPGPWHDRVLVAHVAVNLLGWIGLTVVGTLVTLWPTVLRTKMAEGAECTAARALPVLVVGVAVTAAGGAAGLPLLVAAGLVTYLAGLALTGHALVDAVRRRPPAAFPALSVGAGVLWLAGCLAALAVAVLLEPSAARTSSALAWLTPYLAAGFGAQVLLGALSHLLPVALGGGPRPVRAATRELDRAAPLRVALTNATLLACVLPVPPMVRVGASVTALAALASWLPLMVRALRASRRARGAATADAPSPAAAPPRRPAPMLAAGVAVAVLVVAAGVAVDPAATGSGTGPSAAAGVAATGRTTHVTVRTRDMRFHPSLIEVPAGNRLVVDLVNESADVHDLVLADGSRTDRVSPGGSTRLTVPVVGRDLDGWCSVLGHRQMGMVLTVRATGAPGGPPAGDAPGDAPAEDGTDAPSPHGHHTALRPTDGSAADDLDLMAAPGDGFGARDAALPPLPPGNRVHRRTFTVRDVVTEVAPGVRQTLWTYGGTSPGPLLHGRVGDRFVITLVNEASVGHSVDFHASTLSPQPSMRTIAPGERLVYRFTARRAGVWMYHCSTMPMSAHIANGLYGAVVVEPPDLPRVDRSYLLVQSELYLGPQDGEADAAKLAAEDPDLVVFNGYADQYRHDPLPARVGERVRVWVLDAGPNRPTSFHVVGGQFDTSWAEGAYTLGGPGGPASTGGSQALGLQAAQGGFVELAFPEPGDYPFVSHLMVDAERGASGLFRVRP